ncbi:hypothetical protein [Pannonibacter sp. SL95]|uniref:hypothetical protein n=1 Tax=Pannonibacter sp. SL95 TaxID=2995153 RepID=UPI002276C96E|nr:hypothetical protein [Pannonibacter sp. SL95]MCY1708356.1 hypothetical protein [Pannonibacter sp. SL95]
MEEQIVQEPRKIPGLMKVSEQDGFGGQTLSHEVQADADANAASFGQQVSDRFTSGDNTAYQLYKAGQRSLIEGDPTAYHADSYIEEHKNLIPNEFRKQFMLADNRNEADAILMDMREQMEKQERISRQTGVRPFIAGLIAGIVDVDAPLALMGGAGVKAASLGMRVAKGAAAGTAISTGVVALGESVSTTGDWQNVPMAALAGMGFGAVGGVFAKSGRAANDSIAAAKEELRQSVADGAPRTSVHPNDRTFANDDPWLAQAGTGSVGAAQTASANLVDDIADYASRTSQDLIDGAYKWAEDTGIPSDYSGDLGNLYTKNKGLGNAAANFHNIQGKLGLHTDFDKMMSSGVVTAQKFAYDMLESASGIVRNNSSGAMIMHHYERKALADVMTEYPTQYKLWAKEHHNFGRMAAEARDDIRRQFDTEVVMELQARYYDGANAQRAVHPAVKAAADAVDRWSATDIEIGKGKPGETSVKGYENLTHQSGYFPQRWSGAQMTKLLRSGVKKDDLIRAIADGYKHTLPGVFDDVDAVKWARAVVNRARSSDKDVDTNLIGILQQDGRDFLEETLTSNGVSQYEAKKLIDKLSGAMAERGQAGQTKNRVDIDLRFTASNGINIRDLVDLRVEHMLSRRARRTAGQAALARKGIPDKATRNAVVKAMLDEQDAMGHGQALSGVSGRGVLVFRGRSNRWRSGPGSQPDQEADEPCPAEPAWIDADRRDRRAGRCCRLGRVDASCGYGVPSPAE